MRKVLSFLLTGTAIFCMFLVNGSLAYARGGTGIYSANQSKSFWAGNTYVRCTYGVDGRTAYIRMNSNDDCDFSIDAVAYDYWDNEYRLYEVQVVQEIMEYLQVTVHLTKCIRLKVR